jgi:hypothetical protein
MDRFTKSQAGVYALINKPVVFITGLEKDINK